MKTKSCNKNKRKNSSFETLKKIRSLYKKRSRGQNIGWAVFKIAISNLGKKFLMTKYVIAKFAKCRKTLLFKDFFQLVIGQRSSFNLDKFFLRIHHFLCSENLP
jgi:hypothetical protein